MHSSTPLGNRVHKKSAAQGSAIEHKYVVAAQGVVDITGELPVILMELNGSGDIVKTHAVEWDGPRAGSKLCYKAVPE